MRAATRARWSALFQHRMAGERPAPAWFVTRRQAAFRPLAAPLAALVPAMPEAARTELARSLFAAVHGMVALGLDELLGDAPLPALRHQVGLVVQAMARGLAA